MPLDETQEDETETETNTETQAPTARSKRRIAVASYDGGIGKLTFSAAFNSTELVIDGSKLPNSSLLAAYGAVAAVQAAYSNSDSPLEAAQECLARLNAGTWSPGPPRRDAEMDPLTQALQEHLCKESGKDPTHITLDYINDLFIPAFQKKQGLESAGAARRKLRQHPDISARVASITADRAKRVAQAVKNAPRERLTLDV